MSFLASESPASSASPVGLDEAHLRRRGEELGVFIVAYGEDDTLRLSRGTATYTEQGSVHGIAYTWHVIPARPLPPSDTLLTFGAAILVIDEYDGAGQRTKHRIMAVYVWPDADLGLVATTLDRLVAQNENNAEGGGTSHG